MVWLLFSVAQHAHIIYPPPLFVPRMVGVDNRCDTLSFGGSQLAVFVMNSKAAVLLQLNFVQR